MKLGDILDSLPEKTPRSRLEPFGVLINKLLLRKRTYREIVGILAEKCDVQVSVSTLHDFVRIRSQRKEWAARRIEAGKMNAPIALKAVVVRKEQTPSNDEARQRIAALKARKPAEPPPRTGFDYNPHEPLRIINPGEKNPED